MGFLSGCTTSTMQPYGSQVYLRDMLVAPGTFEKSQLSSALNEPPTQ